MKSRNSYSGIDPKVVNLIKFYAKHYKSLTDQDIEDIEQDLFCEFLSCIDQYDKTKGSLSTFAKQVVKNRINNLVRKHSRTTLNLKIMCNRKVTVLKMKRYYVLMLSKLFQNYQRSGKFYVNN